jgi:hypothetical protein
MAKVELRTEPPIPVVPPRLAVLSVPLAMLGSAALSRVGVQRAVDLEGRRSCPLPQQRRHGSPEFQRCSGLVEDRESSILGVGRFAVARSTGRSGQHRPWFRHGFGPVPRARLTPDRRTPHIKPSDAKQRLGDGPIPACDRGAGRRDHDRGRLPRGQARPLGRPAPGRDAEEDRLRRGRARREPGRRAAARQWGAPAWQGRPL